MINFKHSALTRYFLHLIGIFCFAYILSLLTINIANSYAETQAETNKEQTTTPQSKTGVNNSVNTGVLVYAIALGLIGMYNMYNSLEIYKRKDEFTKELRAIVEQYTTASNNANSQAKDMELEYKIVKNEVNSLMVHVGQKAEGIKKEIEDTSLSSLNKIKEELKGQLKSIAKREADFDAKLYTFDLEFRRHVHNYNLYSLIPDYIDNLKNRTFVKTALFWFSQYGKIEDIEMLHERKSKVYHTDKEILDLIDTAVSQIEGRAAEEGVKSSVFSRHVDSAGRNFNTT